MDEGRRGGSCTRLAVECMTLWMERDRVGAAIHVAHLKHDPDGPGGDEIIVGLLNLSHILLLQLAKERGATTAEELAEGAREILCDLSLKLSE